MNFKLLPVALLAITSFAFAQQKPLWKAANKSDIAVLESSRQLPQKNLLDLDVNSLKTSLINAPERKLITSSNKIISLPNEDGKLEKFKVYENPTMDPALSAKYPEIKSYVGIGIDNPTASVYFSISPLGFKSMKLEADKSAVFIEPISQDLKTYSVYKKSDKATVLNPFECKVAAQVNADIPSEIAARPNADDAILRTFRLAMSVTGEYTAYFGGTKALALAAINASMTRVNGVFEKDFAVRMVLIANNDAVIYTAAASDPYSAAATGSGGAWNAELQNTLTSVIGEANYDVGHLFGASGGGGNAGCIGCVCVNGSKGSGFTSPGDGIPSGDNFDIDYVAHELGHQFGANHTFTTGNEGTGAHMEPGSGSTIMGYAGITSLDVQPHSDAYFHAFSIQQVTNNIKTKTCQTNTTTGNAIPVVNAGLDYTVPKSTPYLLTGVATDANGDALTYNWEQFNSQTTTAAPSVTKTSGVNFRSYPSSTSPSRSFPRIQSVLTGAITTAGTELTVEALSSVARTLNFRLTVRDNRAGGSGNNSDDMIVTVNATSGPFAVSAPNTAVSYAGGSAQTVTWAVAGTTANGVNCANVDILISIDGGNNWTTLLSATPNDGTEAVTMPNTPGTTNRIMVRGTNHIFYDISNTNFTITAGSTDTVAPTAATLSASGTTQTGTSLSWTGATDNVAVTSYDVYRGATLLANTASMSYTVSGLTASTTYSFTVKAKDAAGNISADSNAVSVTTLAPATDTTAPTAATLSTSGTTQTTTNLSWTGATDNVAVTGYEVYQGATLLGTTTTSTTFVVSGLTASTTYSFTVKAKDAAGNVSVASNAVSVTTTAVATVTYCASQGNSVVDEKIGRVQFGTINNPSTGGTGYTNFTTISTNITRGTANAITITPQWTSTVYSEGYAVWIDYNKNGLFTDAGELVFSKATSTATTATGTITIPAATALGATRMRVSMKYNGIPTSCEAFSYGQVEDYTVNIVSTARGIEASTLTEMSLSLYPNPANDILNISGLEKAATYRVLNVLGQEVSKGTIDNGIVSVSNLNTGTYLLEITTNKETTVKRFIKN
jgi:chitodextrinase